MRNIILAALIAATALPAYQPAKADPAIDKRVAAILAKTPLIDGHNDLPWALREGFGANWPDLSKGEPKLQTDIPRLRAGKLGGQFWSVWVPVDFKGDAAVTATLEQIDAVKRLVASYPGTFELATTAADVRRIHKAGRIASMMGVEGGHQIGNSMGTLRQYQALGVRYMTLTHTSTTDWADSATDVPRHNGLTPFGKAVVLEMNRLGILVDLSHVSPKTMTDALAATKAPVIFSHQGARALVDHPRNVSDDVLKLVAVNGGVVMVDFVPGYVSAAMANYNASLAAERARYDAPPYGGLYIGQPDRAKAALEAWKAKNPPPAVTLAEVANHIDHIARVAGVDHVGIGSDFDGITEVPVGLENVATFPALFAELAKRGWSDKDMAKLAGENILRVMAAAEAVAKAMGGQPASTATLAMDLTK